MVRSLGKIVCGHMAAGKEADMRQKSGGRTLSFIRFIPAASVTVREAEWEI